MNNREKIGVVLFNLGGPDSLDAVKPFLFNLFNDPDIINFPFSFLFRRSLAKLISEKRSTKIMKQYEQIGGKSPLLELSQKQAAALELELNKSINCRVYLAMRYWHPFTDETIRQIQKDGIDKIILLPLYPQYSVSTTGSSKNEWDKVIENFPDVKKIRYALINNYHDFPVYTDSIIEGINKTLQKFPEEVRKNVVLLFSSHGTPVKLVKQGDPYKYQIENTVKCVMERGKFIQKYFLSFQSKVGPQKWIEPKTPDVIKKLANEGIKYLLVIPIAFVSDHLETLFEIGIEFRHLAEENGFLQFEVMPGLNDSPLFIRALKELVLSELEDLNGHD